MKNSFTIHDLPKEERPRERLVKFGEQALSAQELLQLILERNKVRVLGIINRFVEMMGEQDNAIDG